MDEIIWRDISKFIATISVALLGVTVTTISILYLVAVEFLHAGDFATADTWVHAIHLGAISALGFLFSSLFSFLWHVFSIKENRLVLNMVSLVVTAGLIVGFWFLGSVIYQLFVETQL